MDQTLFTFIHGFIGRSQMADDIIIILARWLPYALGIGALLLLSRITGFRRRVFFFAQTALILLVTRGIIVELLHVFLERPRPAAALGIQALLRESGNGMPSGHAAALFGLAVALWAIDGRWGKWYVALASVNAVARVASGVHWPSDVLAGACIGIVVGLLVRRLLLPFLPPRTGEEVQKLRAGTVGNAID